MESVWWVFSQLYAKGLVYRGCKVMPYSTACSTALSNFEAGQNYKDVTDPTVTIAFPIDGDAGACPAAALPRAARGPASCPALAAELMRGLCRGAAGDLLPGQLLGDWWKPRVLRWHHCQ
jgi:hypothetical protein